MCIDVTKHFSSHCLLPDQTRANTPCVSQTALTFSFQLTKQAATRLMFFFANAYRQSDRRHPQWSHTSQSRAAHFWVCQHVWQTVCVEQFTGSRRAESPPVRPHFTVGKQKQKLLLQHWCFLTKCCQQLQTGLSSKRAENAQWQLTLNRPLEHAQLAPHAEEEPEYIYTGLLEIANEKVICCTSLWQSRKHRS